jgi:hypothetical protein
MQQLIQQASLLPVLCTWVSLHTGQCKVLTPPGTYRLDQLRLYTPSRCLRRCNLFGPALCKDMVCTDSEVEKRVGFGPSQMEVSLFCIPVVPRDVDRVYFGEQCRISNSPSVLRRREKIAVTVAPSTRGRIPRCWYLDCGKPVQIKQALSKNPSSGETLR